MQMTLSKNLTLKLQMVLHITIYCDSILFILLKPMTYDNKRLWHLYGNVTKINSVTVTCSLKIMLTNMQH
jgi:hypothetical protein